ncbi:hypothetical protein I5907_07410 [Panacibacter sp. DH6]|uniref:Lipoprotein n=1 Tax=Panacibacter microcysteis TaxID=2793269 RepID=A0A931E5U7_9BACT|nr:hypothetical protein [Panacibacter microcysteis]MBG9376056.1 hypothetical protein [Panacibacter microcysteis]
MKTVYFIIFVFLLAACKESSMQQYNQLVQKELSTGKRVDTLFYGIAFGMDLRQFYKHCWELNKQGIFTDGTNNRAILYKLNNHELKHDASMNFFPEMAGDKIYKMQATFQYNAWAPWNKHLYADSLLPDVLQFYRQWYRDGNPFIQISDEEKGTIYVKVDGNRRITIGRFDDRIVKVDYTDLSVTNATVNE